MSLSAGTKVGTYEVVSKLGEGGMGEVYRARDIRLNRDVALKVLPETFATDPERLARLTREAQTLASLSHANIAHVYGLEQIGAAPALAMELVEGPTLEDVIKNSGKGLPASDALPVALQIAAALEAAHDRGVVHRDLKPANIKVQDDGVVKVLDFGLAKAIDPMAMSGGSISNSPTLTGRMTQLGVILGTAAYMAPEQARGKAVDRRADIWAFGCVLYEMLTARRPFDGSDIADALAKILEREPDWTALPEATPPPVRHLIARCLAKDPKQRLRDIGEARIVIDDVMAGRAVSEPARVPVAATPPPRSVWPWAVAALAIVVAVAAWAWPRPGATVDRPVMRVAIDLPFDVEVFSTPLISANGQTIAFVGVRQGVRQVYYRRLSESEVRPVRGSETAGPSLAISPDGAALAFVTSDGRLHRVTLDGGVPQPLAVKADFVWGAEWVDDEILFTVDDQLVRVNATGGEPRVLAPIDKAAGEIKQDFPTGSSTAPLILFRSVRSPDRGGVRLHAIERDGGQRHDVGTMDKQVRWFSSSQIVFGTGGTLFAAPFDPSDARISTDAVSIVSDVGSVIGGLIGASVADDGTIVYLPNTARRSQLVWVAPDGSETALPLGARAYQNPRVSPDGRWIAFTAADGLFVIDIARGSMTKPGPAGSGFPIWLPDSRRILTKDVAGGVLIVNADATGTPKTVPGSGAADYPASTTPDGKTMAVIRLNTTTSGDVYMIPIDEGEAKPLIATPAYEGAPQISADGKWLLYSSDDSGRMEVYLRRLDDANRRWTVSTTGGLHPIWSRDGKRVFYRTGQQLMSADITLEPDVKLGTPRVVLDRRYEFGPNISQPNYSLHPDNQRLLMVKPDPSAQSLQLILNWPGLTKK